MPKLTEYELERQANISKNRALLEELDLKGAASRLGLPASRKAKAPVKSKAKPIQSTRKPKPKKEDLESAGPRRQSTRLRKDLVDPNESPGKKRKREEEAEARRQKAEDERLEAEERAWEAKRPRHQDLDFKTMGDDLSPADLSGLTATLEAVTQAAQPKRIASTSAFMYDEDDKRETAEVAQLRESMQKLKVVSRAKVTQDRIYSAAYHPEKTKDLIFFGDKHGQLGIWDAQAPIDEVEDDDGDVSAPADREGGRYWRLQPHWPATSKSSISTVKLDPIDSHSVFTSAYDCTVRSTSFTSGSSREIYSTEDTLISSIDLPPTGQEMWISDADGGLTHLDLRQDKSKAQRWELSQHKIGCVSVNPTSPSTLLTASNDRTLKVWDARKLQQIPLSTINSKPLTPPPPSPSAGGYKPTTRAVLPISVGTSEFETVQEFTASKDGRGTLRCESLHNKSVSSAYWDPRGRSIVSTCYDDNLRIWDIDNNLSRRSEFRSFEPFCRMHHNCQTGKWLTILKAQWSPNPDVYPHFTIGNMDHSLDVFTCKGDVVARLSDRQRITAVQAVTCSHPSILERAASGNASGRCVLWAPQEN